MTKKHEWKSVSFIRHSCSLLFARFILKILKCSLHFGLFILKILKCSLHFGRFILKILKILVFLVTRILILVILLIAFGTWSGAIRPEMVAPSTTCTLYFFQNTKKSPIKPITNRKSVSFIRHSRSLHYGRFVLILFLFFRGD